MNSEQEITSIANKYHTDKGDQVSYHPDSKQIMPPHHYSRHYAKLFSAMKNDPLALLEIGLNVPNRTDCASIQLWLEYFPNAMIYGVDINPAFFPHKRTKIFQGNQNDETFWNDFITKVPDPFDIIIDDGSHCSLHQQKSLSFLFPKLKEGGVYIIEDIHFSTFIEQQTETLSTLHFLQLLKKTEAKTLKCQTPFSSDLIDTLIEQIESITFYDSATYGPNAFAVLKKAVKDFI
ncbi:MAG: class I SAM-dependent methyltransferase [Simkaniaceae bacterium]|nr:MAG: class I SAM-dependent methyltransferase [Simkaniaceae bacterium]